MCAPARLFVIPCARFSRPPSYWQPVLTQRLLAIGYEQFLTSWHREAPVFENEALQPESRKSPSPGTPSQRHLHRLWGHCCPHALIARFPHTLKFRFTGNTLTSARMQLSRNKDSSKSSKKKDPKDGTASPGSTSQNSPTNTPSSSTSTLNDIRNKPLPPNSAGTNDGGAGATGQSPLSNMTSAPGSGPFGGALGSSPQSSNGASQRGGNLPPTVIISPSASVRYRLSLQATEPN